MSGLLLTLKTNSVFWAPDWLSLRFLCDSCRPSLSPLLIRARCSSCSWPPHHSCVSWQVWHQPWDTTQDIWARYPVTITTGIYLKRWGCVIVIWLHVSKQVELKAFNSGWDQRWVYRVLSFKLDFHLVLPNLAHKQSLAKEARGTRNHLKVSNTSASAQSIDTNGIQDHQWRVYKRPPQILQTGVSEKP